MCFRKRVDVVPQQRPTLAHHQEGDGVEADRFVDQLVICGRQPMCGQDLVLRAVDGFLREAFRALLGEHVDEDDRTLVLRYDVEAAGAAGVRPRDVDDAVALAVEEEPGCVCHLGFECVHGDLLFWSAPVADLVARASSAGCGYARGRSETRRA